MKNKTDFIAEVGSNHNLSLKRCYKIITEAKNSGATAVKFQHFKLEKLFSSKAKNYKKIAKEIKKRELPDKFIPKIFNYCKKIRIKFGCTPFDLESVDLLKEYVDFFKISSYELNWKQLIEKCSKIKKPLIISTGAANIKDIKKVIKILKKNNHKNYSLLHCVSNYPAKPTNCNLKSILYLKKVFKCKVGWSDHTKEPLIIYSAIRKFNSEIVEFHFDLDKKGWEFKEGHCWLPHEIKKVITYLKSEKKIDGEFNKTISKSEFNERKYKADPSDGLRPLKKVRLK